MMKNRIAYNNLDFTHLTIQEGALIADCSGNKLKSITCNKELQILKCNKNLLRNLTLNEGLKQLECNDNNLASIKCNKMLRKLYANYNNLTELELYDVLEGLECKGNLLVSINYIPNSLKTLYCKDNDFNLGTRLRIIKWYLENDNIYIDFEEEQEKEIDEYIMYLVLLLELNPNIIKYLGYV